MGNGLDRLQAGADELFDIAVHDPERRRGYRGHQYHGERFRVTHSSCQTTTFSESVDILMPHKSIPAQILQRSLVLVMKMDKLPDLSVH